MSTQLKNSINEPIPPYITSSALKNVLNKLNLHKEIKINYNILNLINHTLDEFLLLIINTHFSTEIFFNYQYIKESLESLFSKDPLVENLLEYAGYGVNLSHYQEGNFLNHTNYFLNLNGGLSPNNFKCSLDEKDREKVISSAENDTLLKRLFKPFNKPKIDMDKESSRNSTQLTRGIYSPRSLYESLRNMCLSYGSLQRKGLDQRWKPTKLNQQLISLHTAVYMSRILEHLTHFMVISSIHSLNIMKESHEIMRLELDINKPMNYELSYEILIHTFYQQESLSLLFERLNMKSKLQQCQNQNSSSNVSSLKHKNEEKLTSKSTSNLMKRFYNALPGSPHVTSGSYPLNSMETTLLNSTSRSTQSNLNVAENENKELKSFSELELNFNSSNSTLKSLLYEPEMFDELLKSDETFKLSLTPSRLKFGNTVS